jgi:hypothetical protein
MGVKVTDADFSACRCCGGACLSRHSLLPEQQASASFADDACCVVVPCSGVLEAAL